MVDVCCNRRVIEHILSAVEGKMTEDKMTVIMDHVSVHSKEDIR